MASSDAIAVAKLAQDLIRRDISIIDLQQKVTYSPREIANYTRWLKHEIYGKLQGQTNGKIVYVEINDFFVVLCSMLATWELGASLFLNDVDAKIKELPYFRKFYEIIDVVIGPANNSQWIPQTSVHIKTDQYQSIKHTEGEPFTLALQEPITPDSICYYTTSSGTTGDPKLLSFTHYQTVALSNQIKSYLSLDENCRPYHFKTLHHGSLFNSFALPLLSSCSIHHCGMFAGRSHQFLRTASEQIKQHDLTHFLVPYNWIRDFGQIPDVDFNERLTMITIMGNTDQEMQDLFRRFRPKQVLNYFGNSEVGTMFISRTTSSNVSDYNPNRFTDKIPHIDYEILPNSVKVKWKHMDDWYVMSDKMVQTDDAIWFYGRDLYLEVGPAKLDLGQMTQFLKEWLGTDNFVLAPDHKLGKLYLNLYDVDFTADQLQDLNNSIERSFGPEFVIADVFNFAKSELEYGMKISGSLLLFLFRERNQ